MDNKDLQKLLDSLDEGPLGKRKDWQWNLSVLGRYAQPNMQSKEALKKKVENRKHKQKQINKKIKDSSPLKKPIICHRVKRVFSTGNSFYKKATIVKLDVIGTFSSITEAAESLQLPKGDITAVLNGRQKTVKRKYTFEYT